MVVGHGLSWPDTPHSPNPPATQVVRELLQAHADEWASEPEVWAFLRDRLALPVSQRGVAAVAAVWRLWPLCGVGRGEGVCPACPVCASRAPTRGTNVPVRLCSAGSVAGGGPGAACALLRRRRRWVDVD